MWGRFARLFNRNETQAIETTPLRSPINSKQYFKEEDSDAILTQEEEQVNYLDQLPHDLLFYFIEWLSLQDVLNLRVNQKLRGLLNTDERVVTLMRHLQTSEERRPLHDAIANHDRLRREMRHSRMYGNTALRFEDASGRRGCVNPPSGSCVTFHVTQTLVILLSVGLLAPVMFSDIAPIDKLIERIPKEVVAGIFTGSIALAVLTFVFGSAYAVPKAVRCYENRRNAQLDHTAVRLQREYQRLGDELLALETVHAFLPTHPHR